MVLILFQSFFYYSAPTGEWSCDERVCVCVCVYLSVRDHIYRTTRPIFTKFLCVLPMAVARSSSGGVVIRLCIFGSMDHDVMFAHKPRLLDVAA